jgi:hypothetical protein
MQESSIMTQNGPSLVLEVMRVQLAAFTCRLLGVRERVTLHGQMSLYVGERECIDT